MNNEQFLTHKRIEWLDIAKGIGIILVVLAHFYQWVGIGVGVGKFIYSFHMPFFIALSGISVAISANKLGSVRAHSKNFIFKRTQSIILQYFYVAVVSLIIYTLIFKPSTDYLYMSIKGILRGDVNLLAYNQAIWFLPMIFLSNIIFYGIIKLSDKICKNSISKNVSIVIISLGMFVIGDFLVKESINLWSIDIALLTMPFNALGYLLFKYIDKILEKFRAIYLIPLSIIWVFIAMIRPYTNLVSRAIGNPAIYFLVGSLAIVILLKICNLLVRYKKVANVLSFLGVNSLIIMSYHMVLHTIIYSAIVPRLPGNIQVFILEPSFFIGLIILIFEIIMPIGIGLILHRQSYSNKTVVSLFLISSLLLFTIIYNNTPIKIISNNISIGSSLSAVENFHVDRWVEQEAKMEIAAQNMNTIIIDGEYIGERAGNEKVYITVNDKEKLEFDIDSNIFTLEIPTYGASEVVLDIKTNFKIDSGADTRNLAFLIKDIKSK